MRINGIGTTWLGATPRSDDNRVFATQWFTFAFIPLIPLRRSRLQLLPHRGSGFAVRELERTALVPRELVMTWLTTLAILVVALAPMVPVIEEVRVKLGIPESWQMPWIFAGIAGWCVLVWRLANWHERRFHPATPSVPRATARRL